MKSELLCDSETDVATKGSKHRSIGVGDVPIHSEPKMHTGAHAYVSGDTGKQDVTAASFPGDVRDAIVLRMQPGKRRANEPLASCVLSFVWTIREPKTGFDITAEASCLSSLGAY